MCGISGFYGEIADDEFDRFLDSIEHRGPDGRGVYKDENLRLGHRRLKILDVSPSGAQPMSYAHRYWITFNGEIYNFLELRQELQQLGFSFQTESDTEVILAAYIAWGEDCQFKFNGMWAFALWDSHEKTLFLSRDRFGVKPLYYFENGRYFAFASEIKAFLYLSSLSIDIDEQAVANQLHNSHALDTSAKTILKGVKQLLPGHSAIFSKQRGISIQKWWNTLDHLQENTASFPEQVEQFRAFFIDACRLRMRSDVPLGTALSGGLDSSSVLCALASIKKDRVDRISSDWQKVFTALYPGTSQDEFQFAKEVIDFTRTQSHFCTIDPESLLQNYEKAVFQFEDIFELPIGPWLLYQEFRRHNTVISIDGHGADEILGGYPHHVESALLFSPWRYREFRTLYPGRSLHSMVRKGLAEKLRAYPRLFNSFRSLYRQFTRDVETSSWLSIPPCVSTEIPSYRTDPRFLSLSTFNRRLYEDFHTFTLPAILRNFDRCSMAHGVEVRAPFMDWRLVTFAFSIPTSAKFGKGYTKRILREAMKGILPESIRARKSKVGFANPLIEWFEHGLKPFVMDRLHSQTFLTSNIWQGPSIRDSVQEAYQKRDFLKARRCWEFIQADCLLNKFKNIKHEINCAY